MKNWPLYTIGLVSIALLGAGCNSAVPSPIAHSDPRNTSYVLEGRTVALINGKADLQITPGASSTMHVEIFGEPVYSDINNDGIPDAAVMLTESAGGSGTYFYTAAAIKNASGYMGTNGVGLGDRIAPQNIEVRNGIIITNYAERKPNEPMTAQPSVGVSKYVKYENSTLLEANVKDDLIVLDSPIPGSTITSPVTITGRARGNWFFEASFPVMLVDWDGRIIAQGVATAKSNWMTTNYVPFEAKLTFAKPTTTASTMGALILKKDNPSEDTTKDNALEVKVDLGK